jgi:peroxiredoxin
MNHSLSLFTCLLLCSSLSISAQDAKSILQQAYQASDNIKNGYYEITGHMKYMSDPDTNSYSRRCWFKKLPKDHLFTYAFHENLKEENKWTAHFLYTGNEFVSGGDSSGTIYPLPKWHKYLDQIKHNFETYEPFTEGRNGALPSPKTLKGKDVTVSYDGIESLNGNDCHKITVKFPVNDVKLNGMTPLKEEKTFWVSAQDLLVLQYQEEFAIVMSQDTMVQFESITVDSFSINPPLENSLFSLASLPAYYSLKEHVEQEDVPLLQQGDLAPDWSLSSLNGDSITLSGQQGKLVLLDFFYKSCFPCLQALPALQHLHEKYRDQGLTVLGLDPFDDRNDHVEDVLAKRNVTYTVVYGNRELPKIYHVTGFPTVYLIDREGKIIFGYAGYGPGTEDELEKRILEHL